MPYNNQNSLANLKPNKPGQPPANIPPEKMGKRGPSIKSLLKRALKMAPEDLEKYYGFEIPARYKGKDKEIKEFIVARVIHLAMAGKMDAVNTVFDRLEGKPNQPVSMQGGSNSDLVSSSELPPELRIELARQMIEEAQREIEDRDAGFEVKPMEVAGEAQIEREQDRALQPSTAGADDAAEPQQGSGALGEHGQGGGQVPESQADAGRGGPDNQAGQES